MREPVSDTSPTSYRLRPSREVKYVDAEYQWDIGED